MMRLSPGMRSASGAVGIRGDQRLRRSADRGAGGTGDRLRPGEPATGPRVRPCLRRAGQDRPRGCARAGRDGLAPAARGHDAARSRAHPARGFRVSPREVGRGAAQAGKVRRHSAGQPERLREIEGMIALLDRRIAALVSTAPEADLTRCISRMTGDTISGRLPRPFPPFHPFGNYPREGEEDQETLQWRVFPTNAHSATGGADSPPCNARAGRDRAVHPETV